MFSFSNFVEAFCSIRFADIIEFFSLVSMIIGILGFGQMLVFCVGEVEKISSISFIEVKGV